MNLNHRAAALCRSLIERSETLRAEVHNIAGATVVDLGVEARGGLEAGLALAEVCLAGLGRVNLVPGDPAVWQGPAVAVFTDQPIAACLASQYAGWQIARGKYFAMGSGPMRAAAGKEDLFDDIGLRERPEAAVGVLETAKLPSAEVVESIAADCGVEPARLTLLAARTASQAGTLQVVARGIETA
ncbi:MAG: methenyltetrahydromethanopterin cyclohydrolase, partial [Candidatus Saccharimonadales bacterium]